MTNFSQSTDPMLLQKRFQTPFFSSSFLTLRKQVAVEYLYVSSRQTTMNEKGSIRKFPFSCPVTVFVTALISSDFHFDVMCAGLLSVGSFTNLLDNENLPQYFLFLLFLCCCCSITCCMIGVEYRR